MTKIKFLSFILVLLFMCIIPCFSDEQVVTPRDVYVGDIAELRYMFQSQTDLFLMADADRINGDVIVLDCSADVFSDMADRCLVKEAVLQRVGITYTLIITFVPWVTGQIEFADLNLNELCGGSVSAAPFTVHLSPVTITSILKKTDSSGIKSPVPPLLLPGTNYVLWFLIIFLIAVLVLAGVFIARFSVITKKIAELRDYIGYGRNAFMAKRKLNALKKKSLSDTEFASEWQKIIRAYLEYRFSCSFSSVTASSLVSVITGMTGDMLNMEQENAVFSLQGLFMRTDYIRYAAGSIDSAQLPAEEHEAVFVKDEKFNIIEVSVSDIAGLEFREKEMKIYGRI